MTHDDFMKLPEYAFPHIVDVDGADGRLFGMTLRDYFAAAALQGMLANGREGNAVQAYRYADGMMKERVATSAPPAPSTPQR